MKRPLYRIYLAPDRFGHLQQTSRHTREFYDIDMYQSRMLSQAHWYRIVQSSPGRVFETLWKAGRSSEPGKPVIISKLGAFMRLYSDLWYVDGRDVNIEQAIDLNRSALTKPRLLALSLAMLTLAFLAAMNHLSNWNVSPLPWEQPLARIVGLTMLLLLAAEQVLNRIQKWQHP